MTQGTSPLTKYPSSNRIGSRIRALTYLKIKRQMIPTLQILQTLRILQTLQTLQIPRTIDFSRRRTNRLAVEEFCTASIARCCAHFWIGCEAGTRHVYSQ